MKPTNNKAEIQVPTTVLDTEVKYEIKDVKPLSVNEPKVEYNKPIKLTLYAMRDGLLTEDKPERE